MCVIFGSRGSKYFMARFHGKQSAYLIKGEQKNFRKEGFFVVAVLIIAVIDFLIAYMVFKRSLSNIAAFSTFVSLLIVTLIFMKKANLYEKFSGYFYYGMKGEGAIFYELLKLSNSYVVFQDISMETANIDFAVIGPTGIFTIEVKSHAGVISFYKYGWLKKHLWQAKGQALFLHNFFLEKIKKDYFINPMLVFSSFRARLKFGLKPQDNVIIVQKKFLIKAIMAPSEVLSEREIKELEDLLIT